MKLSSIVSFLKGGEVQGGMETETIRDVWVKYEIAPGLEIHVRRDVEERDFE